MDSVYPLTTKPARFDKIPALMRMRAGLSAVSTGNPDADGFRPIL